MSDDTDEWKLTPDFQQQLIRDGFVDCVGFYEIKGNCHKIELNKTCDRRFTIYSFVSFVSGGKHIRIGKAEKQGLKGRLRPYWVNEALHLRDQRWVRERMVGWQYAPPDATPDMLSEFGQFAGGTPPWERECWVEYTAPCGGRGLIFARAPAIDDEAKRALEVEERRLIERYCPPCNRDLWLASAKQCKAEWVAKHGRDVIRIKRGRKIARTMY
ncbi:MAG TPA: hypothetical protein VN345_15010 [Blastocatellia bacterium]|jgi:hypothetical protein|nr:hypothetical protein [Blastocatellia bacterium]